MQMIEAARVERDGNGWWWHPDLPDFGDPDDHERYVAAYDAWIAKQGLRVFSIDMEGDGPEDHPYWSGDCQCNGWEPSAPPGDGWFVLCIADTEIGPVCWWVRREGER